MLTQSSEITLLVQVLLVYGMVAGLRAGVFSLAPVAFAICGGYIAALLLVKAHWGFPPSIVASVVGTMFIGALLALPLVRLTGIYVALATFAFLFVVQGVVSSSNFTGASLGIIPIPGGSVIPLLLVLCALNLVGWYLVDHSFVGRTLDTVGQNPVLAASAGVNVPLWRLGTLLYSAAMGAVGGACFARSFYEFTPTTFDFTTMMTISAYAIVAGYHHWLTPLVVVGTVGLIPQAFSGLDNWALILQGVVMVAVVVLYPAGLSGIIRRFTLPARTLRESRFRETAMSSAARQRVLGRL